MVWTKRPCIANVEKTYAGLRSQRLGKLGLAGAGWAIQQDVGTAGLGLVYASEVVEQQSGIAC